jgi:MoaA/NifB/PqqE/SkfB family radical SAM enzyme
MEEEVVRMLDWSAGKEAGPLSVEIWPTHRCNLHCAMCGTWASRRRAPSGDSYDPSSDEASELPEEKLIELVGDAVRMGAKRFLLTGGGEPFVRKSTTMKVMIAIKDGGAFGNINTNGTLLSEEDVRRIVEMGWDMVMISLDGSDAHVHDSLRGVQGTFSRVERTLGSFKRAKAEMRSELPKMVFNSVITNFNYSKIVGIVELAAKYGVEDITFMPLIGYDDGIRKLELDDAQKAELSRIIPGVIDAARKLDVNTNLRSLESFYGKHDAHTAKVDAIGARPSGVAALDCYEPFLHLLIKPNGEVSCCCMVDSVKDDVRDKSLKDVWSGAMFKELRAASLDRAPLTDCKNCVFSQSKRNSEIRSELESRMLP